MQNKYSSIVIALLLICFTSSFSQSFHKIDWDERTFTKINDTKNDLLGLFSNHYVEYVNSEFSDRAFIYETLHLKTKVNKMINDGSTDEIIISKINVLEILDIKARIIKNDSIVIYDFPTMKKFKSEDSNNNFDYYKIPNVGEKDIVEVIHTVKKDFNFNGNKTIEKPYPILSSVFFLIENDFKSNIKIYNSPNSTIIDTLFVGKKSKFIKFDNLKGTVNEQYATPIANKIKVSYQCYTKDENISQIEYWDNLIKNVEELFFPKIVNQMAAEIIQEIKNSQPTITDNELVFANEIDEYVKNNFVISSEDNQDLNNIDYIFKNKTSNDFSIIQVYTNLLKQAKIDYEVAISCNRYFLKFDPNFFDPNQLREFVIYLPEYEKYISPNRIEYRVSEAPDDLLGNYGVFIEKSLEYYFSEITHSDKSFSTIKKDIKISIPRNLKKLKIQESRSFTGYWAIMNRNYIYLSENEKTDFLVDYFTINGLENKKVNNYLIENFNLSDNHNNTPLLINSSLTTTDLIQQKDGKLKLNIGKVIGLQSNLFNENDRINPIEINFPNSYHYKIQIDLPKGLKLIDYTELNRSNQYVSVDGTLSAEFNSKVRLIDNKIEIIVVEYYKQLKYNKARYLEFREVINAAAEFYESSMILEKI